MENLTAEQQISHLKWKALPLFERLINKKYRITKKKFYTKLRQKEMKRYVMCSGLLLIMLTAAIIYLLIDGSYSAGLVWFFIISLVVFIIKPDELLKKHAFLKELRSLKKELKRIK